MLSELPVAVTVREGGWEREKLEEKAKIVNNRAGEAHHPLL